MKTMIAAFFSVALLGAAPDPVVRGDYVEARTCDVWTGPCFSNSEINIRGKEAVAGWSVEKGIWDGETLDGLKVVAVLKSEGTLHSEWQGKVQAAMYVDQKATTAQAAALVSMARALSSKLLSDIVAVERGAISLKRDGLEAALTVGEHLAIRTAPFCPCDSICCHEEQSYPSICESAKVECAKTLENTYKGDALKDVRWSELNKRSGMVGRFAK